MKRGKFVKQYAKNSGCTVRSIRSDHRLVAMRCDCGDESCQGWAMIPNILHCIAMHRKRDGRFHKQLHVKVYRMERNKPTFERRYP